MLRKCIFLSYYDTIIFPNQLGYTSSTAHLQDSWSDRRSDSCLTSDCQAFKGLICALVHSLLHCQHVSPWMSHRLKKTPNKLKPVPPFIHLSPSILSPVMWTTAPWCGEHSSFWRAWLIFNRKFESAVASLEILNTTSALTFHLYLLNRQTSLGCLTDAQSHLLHKSQISAKRSMLHACQDKQNMLDYKYTLQTHSMCLWIQNIQNRLVLHV